MNTVFAVILTVMSALPSTQVSNTSVTLNPETTITFEAPTITKAMTNCNRVAKALATSGRIAFCGEAGNKVAEVSAQ